MKTIPTLLIICLLTGANLWAQDVSSIPPSVEEAPLVDQMPDAPKIGVTADQSIASIPELSLGTDVADAVENLVGTDEDVSSIRDKIVDLMGGAADLDITKETDDGFVSLNFEDVTLADIIRAFQETVNVNIIAGSTEELQQKVSVKLNRVPWQSALSAILEDRGFELIQTNEEYGIFKVSKMKEEIRTATYILNHASVNEVVLMLNDDKEKPIAKGFPASNTVVVSATNKTLDETKALLKAIDKPTPQVYIDARFIRLSAQASKQLGMKWDTLMNQSLTMSTSAGMGRHKGVAITDDSGMGSVFPSETGGSSTETDDGQGGTSIVEEFVGADVGNVNYRGVTGTLNYSGLQLALSAFEQMDGATTFSNPKIIVANETLATIDMTTKSPAVKVKILETDGESERTSIETELMIIPGKKEPWVGESYFSYGIELVVLPRICPDGTITVAINPSISSKIGDYEVASSNVADQNAVYSRYPIIKMQRLTTKFSMLSGSTAVIGGLTETSEVNIDSGIPLLRDIPWAGPRLFGWKSRQKTQDEIIILVTVGIIDPRSKEDNMGMPVHSARAADLIKKHTSGDMTLEMPHIDNLKK